MTVFPTFGPEGRWHYRRSLASRVTLLTTMAVGLTVAIVALGAYVTVRMQQYGMLGQQIIDFVQGDESSGRAPDGAVFVGERLPSMTDAAPALIDMLGPVSEEATATLTQMRETLANLNEMTGEGGDLRRTVVNAREFTNTIKRQPWRLVWKSKDHDKEAAKRKEADEQEAKKKGAS